MSDTDDPRALIRAEFGARLAATLTDAQATDVHQVFTLIAEAEGSAIAGAWLIAMSPHLDNDNPIDVIKADRTPDVIAAARRYLA